jgi:hypothetical protein
MYACSIISEIAHDNEEIYPQRPRFMSLPMGMAFATNVPLNKLMIDVFP